MIQTQFRDPAILAGALTDLGFPASAVKWHEEPVRAVRASAVEWDEARQPWTAQILASGERLGPSATRADAVAAERAVLATGLDRGVEDHAGRLSAPTRSLGQV